MKAKINGYKNYFVNLIFPTVLFGSVIGILTAIVIALFKFCAKHIISISETGYTFLRNHLYLIPIILPVLFLIAVIFSYFYRKSPNLQGGGIPTSIGMMRGTIPFKWLKNLIGIFFLSLTSFILGAGLGTEGPSVQMGTLIGKGSVHLCKKHKAWDRYSMIGGACAGFTAATGAPLSGLLFMIEESHQSISPMIIIVTMTSVIFARLTSEIISPILAINQNLFTEISLPSLPINSIWIAPVIGIITGLFAVIFLQFYRILNGLFNKKLGKIPQQYKIFTVLAITFILGLCSYSFISTGHHLTESLLISSPALVMLVLILIFRTIATLSANISGITGGLFLPIIALGAVISCIALKFFSSLGLDSSYYTLIVALGITACIAGMLKAPITAIIFSIEALSCYTNILPVIVVSTVSFIITEIFSAKSITDCVLEDRVEKLNNGKISRIIDTFVVVKENSFAIGKQVRDILWPSNLFVLSVQHKAEVDAHVDANGESSILEGDILHIRYCTYDEAATKTELMAIVGEQNYNENIDTIV